MLMLPSFYFCNYADNYPTGTPTSTYGTSVTAGASNADGSSVSILSALAFDACFLSIGVAAYSLSNNNGNALIDILIDPAGGTSWSSFIDDLIAGWTPVVFANHFQLWYHFPIWIPAGASLGARARTAHTADITGKVLVEARGNPSRPDQWWCGQKVETLGADAANSRGTAFTSGNSGANGSWTTLGTSTARYGAIQLGVGGENDTTGNAVGYYYELGIGSNKVPFAPTFYGSVSSTEAVARTGFNQPLWCDVPESTAWQVRGRASGTAQPMNAAAYGVY